MPAGLLSEARHALRIFGCLVALRYKARLMYPAAYYAFLAAKLIGYVSEYAVLWLLVSRFKTIAGWTLPELLLLHSLNVISYTLAASFAYHVARNIEQYVVTGELDTVLLQPVHPLVWLCGFFYSPTHVSQTILVRAQATFLGMGRWGSWGQARAAQTRSASSWAGSRRSGSTIRFLVWVHLGSMALSQGLLVGK
jgi:hypothetical protein